MSQDTHTDAQNCTYTLYRVRWIKHSIPLIYLFTCGWWSCVHNTVHMWSSEDNLWESALSFHPVGPWNWIKAVGFHNKCWEWTCWVHLTGPNYGFCWDTYLIYGQLNDGMVSINFLSVWLIYWLQFDLYIGYNWANQGWLEEKNLIQERRRSFLPAFLLNTL